MASEGYTQTCLPIEHIQIEGATIFTQEQLQAVISERPVCLGLGEFDLILQQLTVAYTEAGYIAARAYLPEQDLSDGSLIVQIIEGTIVGIDLVENGTPRPERAWTAFPGLIGQIVSLPAIEQGIAQINALPSSRGVSDLAPGAQIGEARLAVEVTQGRPWRIGLRADNRGSATTGKQSFGLTAGFDNLLWLNDRWSLDYSRSTASSPLAFGARMPVGRSLGLTGTLPYGFWTFGLSVNGSDYRSEIPAVHMPILTTGWSRSAQLSAERLIWQEQSRRLDAGASLLVKDNLNEVLGSRVDNSSRSMSLLDLWVSFDHEIGALRSTLKITSRHGLDAFGATESVQMDATSPSTQYSAILLDWALRREWQVGDQPLEWRGAVSGQHSNDPLFGSEQFAVGGYSGVRGVPSSVLFGNRGVQWLNTFRLTDAIAFEGGAAVTPYWGFDAGYIAPQTDLGIERGFMTSATFGFEARVGEVALDMTYSKVLNASATVAASGGGIVSAQARWDF